MGALHKRMTLNEFLAWDPGDTSGRVWQLINGEPVAMTPGSHAHGAIQGETARLLGNRLVDQRSPCHVITQLGIVPRVRANRNYRVPDLGVTCVPASRDLMVSEPILPIEVLSSSNEAETWADIWAYASLPSVQEILAIHSTRIEAELLRRNADGSWPADPKIVAAGGELALTSTEFSTPLNALYRTLLWLRPDGPGSPQFIDCAIRSVLFSTRRSREDHGVHGEEAFLALRADLDHGQRVVPN